MSKFVFGTIPFKEAAPDYTEYIIEVDADFAARLLELNTRNRRKDDGQVQAYERAMESDDFYYAAAPAILVSEDGVLLDGQTRLEAARRFNLRTGKTIKMRFICNLPDRVSLFVDSGRTRTFNDALRIQGVISQANVSPVTRALYSWLAGVRGETVFYGYLGPSKSKPTNAELSSFLFSEEESILETVSVATNANKHVPAGAAVLGLAYHLFKEIDREAADEFFRLLTTTGVVDDEGNPLFTSNNHPILQLRERISTLVLRQAQTGTQVRAYIKLAYVIKAWNLWRMGAEVKRLTFKPARGKNAKIKAEKFPEPI